MGGDGVAAAPNPPDPGGSVSPVFVHPQAPPHVLCFQQAAPELLLSGLPAGNWAETEK